MHETILLPTDGSEGTERAVEQALALATAADAPLYVPSVVDTGAILPDVGAERVVAAMEEAGEAAVEEVVATARDGGHGNVVGAVEHGTLHRTILDYPVDLIVTGTHARTGLDRCLLGSVTERVVRMADVPALTVRTTGGD